MNSRVLLLIAPLFISGYGVIRNWGMADGQYGPGADWQAAHIVALIGMVLFVPVVLGLGRRLSQTPWRTSVVVATLVGLATSMVQFGADIVFAARAADKAEMRVLSREFSDIPGVDLAFYKLGPQLFFLGLVVLAVLLARARQLPWWSPVVMLTAIVLPPITLDLIWVSGLLIAAALSPLMLRESARSRSAQVSESALI